MPQVVQKRKKSPVRRRSKSRSRSRSISRSISGGLFQLARSGARSGSHTISHRLPHIVSRSRSRSRSRSSSRKLAPIQRPQWFARDCYKAYAKDVRKFAKADGFKVTAPTKKELCQALEHLYI